MKECARVCVRACVHACEKEREKGGAQGKGEREEWFTCIASIAPAQGQSPREKESRTGRELLLRLLLLLILLLFLLFLVASTWLVDEPAIIPRAGSFSGSPLKTQGYPLTLTRFFF